MFHFASILGFALVLTLAAHAPVAAQPSPSKPNVIVILADDLGYGDVGAYGATRIKTPNIDRLAADGMRFTNAYASANVCTPSRAGLITGRYPIRSGLAWKVVEAKSTHGLPESEETIAELAKRAGYRTLLVGKWHLGGFPTYSPAKHGFDEFFGVPHSNDMPDFALFDGDRKLEQPVEQTTLTQRYTQRTVAFIESERDQPFLIFLSHTFPHIPLFASEEFQGKSDAGLFGDTVEELDHSTGQVVEALRAAGVLENTLIFFTSDNGPFFEGSSGGLRGGKGNTWEGGYRVPFVAFWPEGIRSPGTSDSITMNMDVFATIAEALSLKPRAEDIDGRSLLPVFDSPGTRVHEHLFYFNNENIVGVRSQDWKYLTHTYYLGSLGAFEKFDQLPGFVGSYPMLLDARGPAGEAYSYADRYPGVVKAMQTLLEDGRRMFYPLRTRPSEPTYPR